MLLVVSLFRNAVLLLVFIKVRSVNEEFRVIITKGYEAIPHPLLDILHVVIGKSIHHVLESRAVTEWNNADAKSFTIDSCRLFFDLGSDNLFMVNIMV